MGIVEFFESHGELDGNPIRFYPYQKRLVEDQSKERIVNKARQIGISTTIAMEALYDAITAPNRTILLVSTGERASKEIMDKVKNILNTLPKFSYGIPRIITSTELVQDSKTYIKFKNNSRIISLPNNPDTIRGFRAFSVYIDEYAHFENPEDVWTAILPSVSRGGKITIVSTPKGKLGEFYRIWDECERGENSFVRFDFPLEEVTDEIMLENIERMKKSMTDIQFRQEYGCEFIDEGITLFPYSLLRPCYYKEPKNLLKTDTTNPIYIGIDFGALRSSTVFIPVEKTLKETGEELWRVCFPIKEFIGKKRVEGEQAEADFEPSKNYFRQMLPKLRPTRVFVDNTGYGIPLVRDLRAQFGGLIYPVDFTNPLKEKLFTNLRILFENQQIAIPDPTISPEANLLVNQLHGLEKKVTQGGYMRYKHGHGKFDDYVWSLAIAVSPNMIKTRRSKILGIRR